MQNMKIFIYQDRISGSFGPITEAENVTTVERSFRYMIDKGSVPDYVLRDTVVYQIGEVNYAGDFPVISPCAPRIVLKGDDFFVGAPEADPNASDCDAV